MAGKTFLTRDEILGMQDLEIHELEIPEWGNRVVLVRGMTGRERDKYEDSLYKQKGKDRKLNVFNARAKLVALCVVDDKGNRLFSDADVAALGDKSSKALDRIFAFAMDLSGIGQEDMDDLTKNSETEDGSDSF